jgi:hypothetical protein
MTEQLADPAASPMKEPMRTLGSRLFTLTKPCPAARGTDISDVISSVSGCLKPVTSSRAVSEIELALLHQPVCWTNNLDCYEYNVRMVVERRS